MKAKCIRRGLTPFREWFFSFSSVDCRSPFDFELDRRCHVNVIYTMQASCSYTVAWMQCVALKWGEKERGVAGVFGVAVERPATTWNKALYVGSTNVVRKILCAINRHVVETTSLLPIEIRASWDAVLLCRDRVRFLECFFWRLLSPRLRLDRKKWDVFEGTRRSKIRKVWR